MATNVNNVGGGGGDEKKGKDRGMSHFMSTWIALTLLLFSNDDDGGDVPKRKAAIIMG